VCSTTAVVLLKSRYISELHSLSSVEERGVIFIPRPGAVLLIRMFLCIREAVLLK
jgi:hypothetical protein